MVADDPIENLPEHPPKVSWSKSAYISFQKACEKIKESSPVNAEKLKETIIFLMTCQLSDHPEKYPLDSFKNNNPRYCRTFEKYSYRGAYRHTDSEIKIRLTVCTYLFRN